MTRVLIATCALVALTAGANPVAAQTDTTRRPDTTRAQPADSARRVRAESPGETDLARTAERFTAHLPNYGFSRDQAIEMQQALTRAGCDAGTADGVIGQRTARALECFRTQQNLTSTDVEPLLTALRVSFAKPPEPVAAPEPMPREPVLPPVLRPDTMYRPDVRARRDSALRRDSVRRDSIARDSTARRDTSRVRVPRH